MGGSIRTGAIAAALAVVLSVALLASASSARAPNRLGVSGYEFGLTLSKKRIDPGRAIVEFQNTGEDPHDLILQRVQGGPEYPFPELGPDEVDDITLRLRRASRYRLWCSLEGHAVAGMEASVRVRRHR
jgi:hypothetical protein